VTAKSNAGSIPAANLSFHGKGVQRHGLPSRQQRTCSQRP
jgi:hypothetical protein